MIKKKVEARRLSLKDWKVINKLLINKDKTIQQIADFYGISRHAIYSMAWRKGWIIKKKKQIEWYKQPFACIKRLFRN